MPRSSLILRAFSIVLICSLSAPALAAKKSEAATSKRQKQMQLAMNEPPSATSNSMSSSLPTSTLQATIPALDTKVDENKERSLEVLFGLLGQSTEDNLVNSKWAGGSIELTGMNKFSKMLAAELNIVFLITTGSYTSQYDQGGKAPNAILLGRALVDFKPIEQISLKAGVLDTAFSDYPTHMEPTGFPGLRQGLSAKNNSIKGEIFAFEGIPTSDTATVRPAEGGVTSGFMAYGASFGLNPEDRGWFTAGASYARWQFNNLTSSAASDSQYLGNTVTSVGSRPRFKYDFGGYEVGASMSAKIRPWLRPEISGAFITNEKAPSDFNKGYIYTGGISIRFGDHEIKPSYSFYYNEPDTLPASYARIGRSYNNRFGNQLAIAYKNKQATTTAQVKYTTANEIDNMPYTADRKVISFTLEKGYDFL